MTIVDAKYEFIMVIVATDGRVSDDLIPVCSQKGPQFFQITRSTTCLLRLPQRCFIVLRLADCGDRNK